jgi:hypothetical protein
MKKGLFIGGVVLSVIGLLLMLFMWPFIGTITWDELEDTELKDGEAYKIIGEVTNEAPPTGVIIYEIEDGEYILITDEDMFDEGDTVIVEFTYDENKASGFGNDSDRSSMIDALGGKIYKVPTALGMIGLILLIVGVILLIVGITAGRGAPMTAQPPMEQPPMQQSYQQQQYQKPPYQQPPYQQLPPQQPPMPPP